MQVSLQVETKNRDAVPSLLKRMYSTYTLKDIKGILEGTSGTNKEHGRVQSNKKDTEEGTYVVKRRSNAEQGSDGQMIR